MDSPPAAFDRECQNIPGLGFCTVKTPESIGLTFSTVFSTHLLRFQPLKTLRVPPNDLLFCWPREYRTPRFQAEISYQSMYSRFLL